MSDAAPMKDIDAGRVRPDRFLTNNKFGQPVANGRGP